MAEIVNHFFPKYAELHNYPATNKVQNKLDNWRTLNTKALMRLGIGLKPEDLKKLAEGTPKIIESLLNEFKKVCETEAPHRNKSGRGE